MKTFVVRTLSAIVYAALFLCCILLPCRYYIFPLFALFVAIGCMYEYYKLVSINGVRPFKVIGYIISVCCFVIMYLGVVIYYSELDVVYELECSQDLVRNSCYNIILSVTSFLSVVVFLSPTILFLSSLWSKRDNVFTDIAHTLLPLIYIVLPMISMSVIVTISFELLLLVVLLVWINDSGAYIVGSLIGKHKLWSRHSPGKTWEGSIGGFVVVLGAALLLGHWLLPGISYFHFVIIAVICSVVGTLGDLFESMLKRSVGVKDSGSIMPGHGGFLDRFDSLLAIMPFAFVYSFFL